VSDSRGSRTANKINWKCKWHVSNDWWYFSVLTSWFPTWVCLSTLLTVFSFKSCFWDGQFSHCRHVKTRSGSGPICSPGQGTMQLGWWVHDLSFMWAEARKTNDRISILYLKCPMYLKLKSQFSRLWHKLKDKRAAFLSSATDSIRHLDFFH
jgi:hypothetical protein